MCHSSAGGGVFSTSLNSSGTGGEAPRLQVSQFCTQRGRVSPARAVQLCSQRYPGNREPRNTTKSHCEGETQEGASTLGKQQGSELKAGWRFPGKDWWVSIPELGQAQRLMGLPVRGLVGFLHLSVLHSAFLVYYWGVRIGS